VNDLLSNGRVQCPDCKGWFAKLANHKKCRGRVAPSMPVQQSAPVFTFSSSSLQETDRIRKLDVVVDAVDPAAPVSFV
jgi:hypothetical protein